MKKAVSILLVLAMLCTSLPAFAAFSDINDKNTALCANVLQSLGIASGTGDNKFSPNTILTRAQFCTFAVRAMGLEEKVATSSYKTLFTDVKPGDWYVGYVNVAYDKGIVKGYGNGKFGPNDPINYGQIVTVLLRILGYTTDDIGKVWPTDDINYAKELGLSDNVSAAANSNINRATAAILLYNMLKTEVNGTDIEYYNKINGVSSVQTAIVLDTRADNEYAKNQLMACTINNNGTAIEYFEQKNIVPTDLEGSMGDILLNAAGKVIGFIPDSSRIEDVVIDSAKATGIVDKSGRTHRIGGSATVIIGEELYSWSGSGYLQIDAQKGKTARIYYNEDGAVTYVYLATGVSGNNTDVFVAETNSAASELARKLNLTSSHLISKNGVLAQESDLAKNDVAYYNSVTNTLCASDLRITGIIESAYPNVQAAETITIGGCEIKVLDAAWDTLDKFKLGEHVTLLLTDDCKAVKAVESGKLSGDMLGILAADGKSITLALSGLTLHADEIQANEKLYGKLVKVSSGKNRLICSTPEEQKALRLDVDDMKLGSYELAKSCAIYEQAGSGTYKGYVYSLDGELGKKSKDLDALSFTDSVASANVVNYHVNSVGKVDVILLSDVTGNCYEYGKISYYSNEAGSDNKYLTVTNKNGVSAKYISTSEAISSAYAGIAITKYNAKSESVAASTKLTKSADISLDKIFLNGGDWYATVKSYEIPISEKVQVHFESTDQWFEGEEGIKVALASGMDIDVYYDKTPTTGAFVRVIVARK